MAKWNTACGWNFKRNPEKVLMSVPLQFNQTKCRKCMEIVKARNNVKEGCRFAGFIAEEAVAMFDPTLNCAVGTDCKFKQDES